MLTISVTASPCPPPMACQNSISTGAETSVPKTNTVKMIKKTALFTLKPSFFELLEYVPLLYVFSSVLFKISLGYGYSRNRSDECNQNGKQYPVIKIFRPFNNE